MFTRLTALTLAATLLTPISANAKMVNAENSKKILYYGEIISVDPQNGTRFTIRYQKDIFYCFTWAFDSELTIECQDTRKD